MLRALPVLAALAGAAVAADTTVIKVIILGDQTPFVGSVINADSSATTVLVQCTAGTNSNDCGLPQGGATITQGTSTWQWNYGYSDSDQGVFTAKANCKLDPANDIAACHAEVTQGSVVQTTDSTQSDYKTLMYPVTITAGADKLSAAAGATGTNVGSNTGTQSAPSQTGSGEASKTSSAGEANKTSSSATSKTGTNAGPMITQNAVLAGVAAVVGGVLAL